MKTNYILIGIVRLADSQESNDTCRYDRNIEMDLVALFLNEDAKYILKI